MGWEMNVALIIFAFAFGPFGLLLLYAAVFHGGRCSSRYERAWAVVSGAGWAAIAAAFAQQPPRRATRVPRLLIAGGLSGVAAAIGRTIVARVSRRS